MDEDHTVIMQLPTNPKSSLYYFQGNFYHPLDLPGKALGVARGGIRKFMKENTELVKRDRAHPEYKTLVELFDEQYPNG